MVEGIIYRYRCGIAWRDVPEVFGPWQTIWTWHRRMSADGTWDIVLARLLTAPNTAGIIDWAVAVDSTIARAHQHATNITRHTGGWVELHGSGSEPPDHGIGRSRGGCRPKIHHLVDGHGRPLVVLVVARQPGTAPVSAPARPPDVAPRGRGRGRVPAPTVFAATRPTPPGRTAASCCAAAGSAAVIPEPSDQVGTANAAVPTAGAHRPSTPSTTAAATSSNAASTWICSSRCRSSLTDGDSPATDRVSLILPSTGLPPGTLRHGVRRGRRTASRPG